MTPLPSQNLNQLASGGRDAAIKIWNLDDGNCIHTLTDHGASIWFLTTHPYGGVLSGCDDTTIKLWDPKVRVSSASILCTRVQDVRHVYGINHAMDVKHL